MIPLSGSAYTYGYATLGEFVAWIIGWDLILEYLFAASTVAVGWSGYVVSFLKELGITIPAAFTSAPYDHVTRGQIRMVEHLATVRPRLDQHRRGAQCPGHADRRRHHHPARHRHQGVGEFQQRHRRAQTAVILTFIARRRLLTSTKANWHPFIPPANTGRAISAGAAWCAAPA